MPDSDTPSSGAQSEPIVTGDRAGVSFADQLAHALARKERRLNEESLPKLREEFHRLHGSFHNTYGIFLKKALISEDPYKDDQKISEVTIPSRTQMLESELSEQIGIRLSEYDSQLEFLNTYYQFSIEFLSLKRIKLLASIAKFINWASLVETSGDPNTRAVAILFGRIRGGSDHFTSTIIADAQRQMSAAMGLILDMLKELTGFHRESYKLEVRREIMPSIGAPASIPDSEVDRFLAAAKKAFGTGALPFYQDLVREVITEDLTPGGAKARQEVLAGLAVAEKQKQKKQQRVESLKPALLEAFRTLAAASRHLESALEKLNSNSLIYEEQKARIGGPFKRWIYRLIYGRQRPRGRVYEVAFVDIATSVSRTERLDFDKFLEEGIGLVRILTALTNRTSPRYSKLEAASDDEVHNSLEQLIIQTQKTQKTLPAIYEFLSLALPYEYRGKLRGIKLEVNGIQNAVVKANQKRHDYASRKAEEDQLKRLGIGVDGTTLRSASREPGTGRGS